MRTLALPLVLLAIVVMYVAFEYSTDSTDSFFESQMSALQAK